MNIKPYARQEALITHNRRFELLYGKLSKHTKDATKRGSTNFDDAVKRLHITQEMVETLIDINSDLHDIIGEMQHSRNITQTALRAYALAYGKELIVSEGDIDFGGKFNLIGHVIPTKGKTTITIEIEDIE